MRKRFFRKFLVPCAVIVLSLVMMLAEWVGIDISSILQTGAGLSQGGPDSISSQGVSPDGGFLELHVIDVGQGLSMFVRGSQACILIDASENNYADKISKYLSDNAVKRLDYVIMSHPHYDHYGGLRNVMKQIPTDEFVSFNVPQKIVPTAVSYVKLLDFLAENKIRCTQATVGREFDLGSGAKLSVIGPVKQYNDLNNNSIVCRVTFGDTAFLLTADMEKKAEYDLIDSGCELSAQVLVVGHHGSYTSSSEKFLREVSPDMAAISLEADNEYGYPHTETLKVLKDAKVSVKRTDLNGTIVYKSDGSNIIVETEK